MVRSQGRGRIWAILFTVPALIMLLALGFWQLHRLNWKEALIAERQAALALPAVGSQMLDGNTSALNFRRVNLRGNFIVEQKLYLGPRSYRGRAGFHVLAPFRLKDGRVLLVNRGFVPGQGAAPLPWRDRLSSFSQAITGILRQPSGQIGLTPDNQPDRGDWYWYDFTALSNKLDLSLLPLVLDLSGRVPLGGLPVPGQTRVTLVNNHLQYAVTWFLFALVLATIFTIFMVRAGSGKN